MRKSLLLGLIALASAAATLPALASAPAASRPPCSGALCAGAGRGDITPPVTTPMWGYTARELVDHSPDVLSRAGSRLSAGDAAGAIEAMAMDSYVADKTGGDTEGYCKTFECNQGIQSRLYANAFVLQDRHGTKLAVVQVDLGGLPVEVHQAVADRIQATTGIDAAHLLISATHTHQGPGAIFQYQGYAILGGDQFDPRVFGAVVTGITNAVQRADASRIPARVAWGQTELDGANNNRRLGEQWCLDPEVHCTADHHWDGTGPTPNNRTLTLIRVDGRNGTPIGVISNFANHGTVGGDDNLLFSGDNQAYAVRDVEAGIAASWAKPLPNGWPVDALINGAQGDQSPASDAGSGWRGVGGTRSSYAAMEGAGHLQAPANLRLWRSLGSRLTDKVDLDARYQLLCFCGQAVRQPGKNYDGDPAWDHVSAASSLGQGGITASSGTSSPVVIPTQGKKLPVLVAAGTNPDVVPMQAFRIGDLLVASVPGEPTVQLGRRLISRVLAAGRGTFKQAIVAGLADDYDSYFTTQEEYRSYAYEASFSLFGPQEGEAVVETQEDLAWALATRTAAPGCTPSLCPPMPPTPPAAAPTPLLPDLGAKTVLAQPPASAPRFQTLSFQWVGGSPSAEWAPDADRVRVERLGRDGKWQTVAGDARGTETLLLYATRQAQHVWTAQWDLTATLPPGVYRLRALGHAASAPGQTAAYDLTSNPVRVTPASSLTVAANGPTVTVGYPKPDPATSFRFRPAGPDRGTVWATVNGACASAPIGSDGTATFAGPVQQVLGARDRFGNTTVAFATCP